MALGTKGILRFSDDPGVPSGRAWVEDPLPRIERGMILQQEGMILQQRMLNTTLVFFFVLGVSPHRFTPTHFSIPGSQTSLYCEVQ